MSEVSAWLLEPVAGIPNNPDLPLLVYEQAFPIDVAQDESSIAALIEARLDSNGWAPAWRASVFDFHHFHTTAHEVLGVFAGAGTLQFGGPQGPVVSVEVGDVVVVPSGVGHCRLSSERLGLVGAYPVSQSPDQWRADEGDRHAHRRRIQATSLPEADPLEGSAGPLWRHWNSMLAGLRREGPSSR